MKVKVPAGDFCGNLIEAGGDGLAVLGGNDALGGQHRGMGAAAGQILFGQPFVEFDGGVYLLHDGGGPLRQSGRPTLCSYSSVPPGCLASDFKALPLKPLAMVAGVLALGAVLGVLYVILSAPVHAVDRCRRRWPS